MNSGSFSHPATSSGAGSGQWKSWLLLVVALVISLLGAEFLLRALGYYGARGATLENLVEVDDEVVDYRRRPNASWIHNNIRYHINGHGWRDYDYAYRKPEGTFRIIVVGDSVTNGYGVELEDIYAKQLEQRLNNASRPPLRYEVLILSVGALSTEQEVHLLEVEANKYDPDLMVIGYVLNDPAPGSSLKAQRRREQRLLPRLKRAASGSSLAHYTYKAAKRIWWRTALLLGLEQTAGYIHRDRFSDLHRDPQKWGRVERAFERVQELAQRERTPVVLLIFPILYQLDDYPWSAVHAQVRAAAESKGMRVLDLRENFKGHRESDLQVENGDHVHPNALGHRLAGDALFEYLMSSSLVVVPDAATSSPTH